MQNYVSDANKAKIIKEHSDIIVKYYKTGEFDRSDALRKFKTFNIENADYCATSNAIFAARNVLTSIDTCTNNDIVENLKLQLVWLAGKEFVDELIANIRKQ